MINKKASTDLIYITITLLTVSILGLIVLTVNNSIGTAMQSVVDSDSLSYTAIGKAVSIFEGGLDKLFLGIYILLLIGMGMLAFFIASSPLFLILFIIISVIATWFSAVISNIYMEIEATGLMAEALTHFTIQTFIMENLPILTAASAFLIIIITYSKNIFTMRQTIE